MQRASCALRSYTPNDPSGFEDCGFTRKDIDYLAGIFNEAVKKLMTYMPPLMTKAVQSRFPRVRFYALPHSINVAGVKARMAHLSHPSDLSRATFDDDIGLDGAFGIAVSMDPKLMRTDKQSLLRAMGHEVTHLWMNSGFGPLVTCDEVGAYRVEEEVFGADHADVDFSADIRKDQIVSSTGLIDGRFQSPASSGYQTLLAIAARHSLPGRVKEIMNVCAALTEATIREAKYRTIEEIVCVMRSKFPPGTDHLLDELLLREMAPGQLQPFIIPFRRKILLAALSISSSPEAGNPGTLFKFSVTDRALRDVPMLAHRYSKKDPVRLQVNTDLDSLIEFDRITSMLLRHNMIRNSADLKSLEINCPPLKISMDSTRVRAERSTQ